MSEDLTRLTVWPSQTENGSKWIQRLTFVRSGGAVRSTLSCSTWPRAKTPSRTGRIWKPAFMSLLPKVRRGTPEAASMPGREASIPRKPAISPLSSEPWLTAAISTRAIIIKVKNSQGPKLTDQRARGGESSSRNSEELTPPPSEEPLPRARRSEAHTAELQ